MLLFILFKSYTFYLFEGQNWLILKISVNFRQFYGEINQIRKLNSQIEGIIIYNATQFVIRQFFLGGSFIFLPIN